MVSNSVFLSWSGSDGLPTDFGADTDHFSAMFINTIHFHCEFHPYYHFAAFHPYFVLVIIFSFYNDIIVCQSPFTANKSSEKAYINVEPFYS